MNSREFAMLSGTGLLYCLDEAADQGWIHKQKHPSLPLLVYCYTPRTQYESHWTDLTKLARGLVLDTNGKIIGKGLGKFFNIGEPSAPPVPNNVNYASFDKLDGSYLQWQFYEGKWICNTKGSFDNPHTEWGMNCASSTDCIGPNISTDLTLMTEVVLPPELDDMRRAAPARPGLYLLGATHTPTRRDLDPTTFYGQGLWRGEFPTIYRDSVDELLAKVESSEGTEGWVVRYANGLRLKIKTAWYLRLFRMISRLDSTVKEHILAGKSLNEILIDVPEELTAEITELYETIMSKVEKTKKELILSFEGLVLPNQSLTRRAFAEAVQNNPMKPYLFKMFDQKDITPMVLKAVVNGELD